MAVKKIAVLGAGNGGHAVAAHKTLEGFEVSLFELPRFTDNLRQVLNTGHITIEWPERKETVNIHLVTTDIAAALESAEVVFVVTPAFGHKIMAELYAPFLRQFQMRSSIFVERLIGSILNLLQIVKLLNHQTSH